MTAKRRVHVSRAATSILVFGVYVMVMGVLLLTIPNVLLGVVEYPTTGEVWIRVLGVVTLSLGYYYVVAGRNELTSFFRASLFTRPSLILFFAIFVALGMAKPVLVAFGLIDLLAAVWTGLALRFPGKRG
jgi:hypothetical protein